MRIREDLGHNFFPKGTSNPSMTTEKLILPKAKSLISVPELKHLLVQLGQQRPDICIRYRLLGEMWGVNFLNIKHVTPKALLLSNHLTNSFVLVSDISMIMQFEIDNSFAGFEPHFHYNVQAI
jgi:hypothetical protein